MLKLAYFGPLPPQQTGIADYSADLLPHLTQLSEVTLFIDALSSIADPWDTPVQRIETYQELRWQYNMAVYQIGNSLYHTAIYRAALRNPGIIVLHDYTLHHFIASITAGREDFPSYLREMTLERGIQGAQEAWAIKHGAPTPLFEIPLTARLIEQSLGVLVHSDYAKSLVQERHPRSQIKTIDQPIPLVAPHSKSQLRSEMGIPKHAFVVITCGAETPEKHLDLVRDSLAELRHVYSDLVWLKTGTSASTGQQTSVTKNTEAWVYEIGYVDGLPRLNEHLVASDVCINLRHPTAGETSASCLRAMAAGIPVIVSDEGWYRELPRRCCPRIHHNGTEIPQMKRILERWCNNKPDRITAGEAARDYVAQHNAPYDTATAYVDFIEKVLHL
jgi:glycosyltransferase involved in cell wall biosynthesis